jgi:hypothetical protein
VLYRDVEVDIMKEISLQPSLGTGVLGGEVIRNVHGMDSDGENLFILRHRTNHWNGFLAKFVSSGVGQRWGDQKADGH